MSCMVPFSSKNFASPGPVPPASDLLATNWEELIYSAITVGRASLSHVTMYGRYSLSEIAFRANLLFANLKNAPNGCLEKTEVYESLDPSEKSAVSYWLGLTTAKLIASRYLDTDFISHLDVYRNFPDPIYKIDVSFFTGGKKPDLVGQTKIGDWIAIEAKGRTNGFDGNAILLAKSEQLANLRTINAVPPRMKVAVESFFSKGVLRAHCEDPENSNDAARDLFLPEREVFVRQWYEPFLKLIADAGHTKRVGDEDVLYVDLMDMDIKFGIAQKMFKVLRDDTYQGNVAGYLQGREARRGEGWYMGREGVFVELGALWHEENMKLEPNRRVLAKY